ncbi:MAG: hypothetical protein H7837_07980 [Magnetococcus sp. MYC-9]
MRVRTLSTLCRRFLPLSAAACCLLLLAACGPESTTQPTAMETELYAGDGTLQTLQRTFFPAAYWREKNSALQERVRKHQEAFSERTRAYHALLAKRREKVNQAIAQAKAAGKPTDEARRLVIQEFRETLDPVREEARQLGKELRRAMGLLARAEIAARRQ